MSQVEHQAARAFYLERFDVTRTFDWDRIGRVYVRIETCIISICGGIQHIWLAPIIQSDINGLKENLSSL